MLPYLAALVPVFLLLVAAFVFAGVAAGSNAYQIKRDYNLSHLWESRERLSTLGGFAVLAFAHELLGPRYLVAGLSIGVGFVMVLCLFGLRPAPRHTPEPAPGAGSLYLCTDPQTAAQDKRVTALGLSGQQFAALKLAGVLVLNAALVWLRWAFRVPGCD